MLVFSSDVHNKIADADKSLLQAALSSLEREAKENVYAVLDPHIQYDITINKHGEPPKYLSLSKPLTHQRTHAFNPQNIDEINNNNTTFTTFKDPPKIRRSNKSNNSKKSKQSYISKTNNDVEYSKDPKYSIKAEELNAQERHNEHRTSKNYTRMYERNNSGRRIYDSEIDKLEDRRRHSNRSWKDGGAKLENIKRFDKIDNQKEDDRDFRPRPGKVKEIASRFNKNSENVQSLNAKRERPKPLQSYGHQAYLDHVFPDAVEI